ncbi:hypothetical protein F4818DRAFT_439299 [Hypoxylon cercidicola]|nr:hypothetical protein F4818DRAFT_439299 [Hypoxylon cercidicola]
MKITNASALLILFAGSASAQDYPDTCGEVRLDDATMNPQYLTGDCDDGRGYTYKTRLDLNLCYSPNEDGIMVPTDRGIGLNTSQSFAPCVDCFIGNGHELPRTYYACDCVGPHGGSYAHSGVYLGKPTPANRFLRVSDA